MCGDVENNPRTYNIERIVKTSSSEGHESFERIRGFNVLAFVCTVCVFCLLNLFLCGHEKSQDLLL